MHSEQTNGIAMNPPVGKRRVIVRLKGGLGNQLFQYAAARRLAIHNDAELVIDDRTGFERDVAYRRQYMLDRFQVAGRLASPRDLLEPFGRLRRRIVRLSSRRAPFQKRIYLEQKGFQWEPRLLQFKVHRWVYLEGYWQSERYFQDVAETIRRDLTLRDELVGANQRLLEQILATNSVAIHLRWFDPPGTVSRSNSDTAYYERSIAYLESRMPGLHYYVFSDRIDAAHAFTALPAERTTIVAENSGDQDAHVDLWLMSRCKHFIIANSTFSWWGAWLSPSPGKLVIAPAKTVDGVGRWGFDGLIPERWTTL